VSLLKISKWLFTLLSYYLSVQSRVGYCSEERIVDWHGLIIYLKNVSSWRQGFFIWFVLCSIRKFIFMVKKNYLQALVRNATDAMRESRVLDVINVVRHIC
jgi:hypothetical protein